MAAESAAAVVDIWAEDVAGASAAGAGAGAGAGAAAGASYGGAGDYASGGTLEGGASVSATQTAGIPATTAPSIMETLKTAATILSPMASLAASASGISAARRAARMPTVSPSTTIPSFGGPIVSQAMQSSFSEQLRRRGRAATILTSDSGEKLGA